MSPNLVPFTTTFFIAGSKSSGSLSFGEAHDIGFLNLIVIFESPSFSKKKSNICC